MEILCFGSINIDDIYVLPHIVKAGETLSSISELNQRGAGGKGANQSVAIARAGGKVWHAGKIGLDGKWILEDKMRPAGVETDLVIIDPRLQTGKAIIQLSREDGENAIILAGNANHAITNEDVDFTFRSLHKDIGMVLLQNEILGNIQDILDRCRSRGLCCVLNPAPISSNLTSRINFECIDFIVVNQIEAEGLLRQLGSTKYSEVSSVSICDAIIRKFSNLSAILLTLGKRGSFLKIYCNDVGWTEFECGACSITPVDTTGAGDTFIGYFFATLCQKGSIKPAENNDTSRFLFDKDGVSLALKRASIASAITCTQVGAMDTIPDSRLVDQADMTVNIQIN